MTSPSAPRLGLRLMMLAAALVVPACGGGSEPGADATWDAAADIRIDTAGQADTTLDTTVDGQADVDYEAQQAAIRAIPEVERWSLPGLHGEAHVVRTEANVPHIYASDEHDLYLVHGFTVARDRYLQLELGRRLGQGRISELLGDMMLSVDARSRGLGWTHMAARLVDLLTDEQAILMDAFADGVNAYIDTVAEGTLTPPAELELLAGLLGKEPIELMRHLTGADIVAYAAVVVSEMGFETSDVANTEIVASLPSQVEGAPFEDLRRAGVMEDLWRVVKPIHAVASAHGWGLETAEGPAPLPTARKRARAATAGNRPDVTVPLALLRRLTQRLAPLDRLMGHDEDFGSNAWAVGAAGTPWDGGLLAGDGHLTLAIPSLFWQIGMDTRVFGGGDTHVAGLVFPGFPLLAVGTNEHVAWTQTYHRGDIIDWYAEELRLDENGVPAGTLFEDEWRPLVRVDEEYDIAEVPLLGSTARSETWSRWTTFDGRWLTAIEGRPATEEEIAGADPGAGRTVVCLLGDFVVPEDMDDDGRISAISFDYTGFDVSNLFLAVDGFAKARDIHEFRESTRRLVAYSQNIVAADSHGEVYYGGYSALPCRGYLERDAEGAWVAGADPTMLLDGTRYGGFRVPLDDAGFPDEEAGATDPYACIVPFDSYPAALSPARGYVLSANNDIAGASFDDTLANDPWYVGGPWAAGYRAATIDEALAAAVADRAATVEHSATLQGTTRSGVGAQFAPFLIETIAAAQAWHGAPVDLTDAEVRALAYYDADAETMDAVASRLEAWLQRGAEAASGVDTFYGTATAQDREDAVATMLFNAWFRAFMAETFDDEQIRAVWRRRESDRRIHAMTVVVEGRGPGNPLGLASWNPETEESIFFDIRDTAEVETSSEIALRALARALSELRAAPTAPGVGGFGTGDMAEWRWGLRHMVRFESILAGYVDDNPIVGLLAGPFSITPKRLPLAESLPSGDPRRSLPWFPRPGDLFAVDAASPAFRGDEWTYNHAPQMRTVIGLDHGHVWGLNIVPGGQSGRPDSPYFDDQAALWLGNEALPLRYHVEDVVQGATGREEFAPAP